MIEEAFVAAGDARVGGMTLQERGVFTLAKAGVRRIYIGGPENGRPRRLPNAAEIIGSDAPPPTARLRHAGRHIVRPETLKELVSRKWDRSTRFTDEGGATVLEIDVPGSPVEEKKLSFADCVAAGAQARRWLLNTARKSTDGFMARHFDRNISLTVTGMILDTSITPNQMTLVSAGIGVLGGLCFLAGAYAWAVLGASLVLLHSVIDGCDGELARLKFMESPYGRQLDFWGDNVVHAVLFLSMGWGLRGVEPIAPWLGLSASAAALGSAWLSSGADSAISSASQGRAKPGAQAAGLAAFAEKAQVALAQRDFIYLLLILSIVGKPAIFLWAAGIGSPVFFLATAALTAAANVKDRKGAAS